MPVGVHHRGPEAHREPAKKSLEDREILGHSCGIYPRISRALRLIRGVGGTRGRLSESDPTWAANGVARHRTRRGSTWVDHVRPEGHVTGTGVTWGFRGGGRTTCRGKSRGDGWDRYTAARHTTTTRHMHPTAAQRTTTRHGAPTPRHPTSGGRTPRTAPCCCTPHHAAALHATPRHAPHHDVHRTATHRATT